MNSTEDVSRLMHSTSSIISGTFINRIPYRKVGISYGHEKGIDNDFALGITMINDDNSAIVRLGISEVSGFMDALRLNESKMDDLGLYVAASMYAGSLLAKNLLSSNFSCSETQMQLCALLNDETDIVNSLILRKGTDSTHHSSIKRVVQELDSESREMIGTVNIQRIGSGIVLQAAHATGNERIVTVANEVSDNLDTVLERATYEATTMGLASGSFAMAADKENKSALKLRGLGYTMPMDKDQLICLKNKLIVAQKNSVANLLIEEALAPEDYRLSLSLREMES